MNILTSSAGQPQNCLVSYHITLAWCPGEQAEYFPMPTGIDGMTLEARRVNTFNGKVVRPTTYTAIADTTLHLFKSKWADLFYITEYQPYRQRYKCSCGVWFCEHVKTMRGIS